MIYRQRSPFSAARKARVCRHTKDNWGKWGSLGDGCNVAWCYAI